MLETWSSLRPLVLDQGLRGRQGEQLGRDTGQQRVDPAFSVLVLLALGMVLGAGDHCRDQHCLQPTQTIRDGDELLHNLPGESILEND